MRYLHTMLRVRDLNAALDFYCNKLGLKEVRRRVDEKNRYTLVFLAASEDEGRVEESKRSGRDAPLVELTHNWDSEDYGLSSIDPAAVALAIPAVAATVALSPVSGVGRSRC